MSDRWGNVIAEEGVDRCACGCKYWERDRCVSCSEPIPRRWECVLVQRLADPDLGLQCYETDLGTDPAVHGQCGWRHRP